jgi:FAD/FMN-containing dehydrogenase
MLFGAVVFCVGRRIMSFDRLQSSLGPQGWTRDPAIIAPHLVEWRDAWVGETGLMLMPSTTQEVADIVVACAESGVALTPQGGNTGLVGAQIPRGEVLVSLKRMNAIRAVEPVDDSMTVEAGVILQNVQERAASVDRAFRLSLASEGSATIGGLISTNAGGVHVRRYGMMRDHVLGLEVVMPDGAIMDALSALRKDNTGYDLKQLFIGAEGTLGIITAATLKLHPRPRTVSVALLALNSADDAIALLHRLESETGAVAAFEIMNARGLGYVLKNVASARAPFAKNPPWLALVEFESARDDLPGLVETALTRGLEAGLATDALLAKSAGEAKAFWLLREEMSGAQKPEGKAAKHDISVPVSAIPRFLAEADAAVLALCPQARIVAFGHASDGNIHYDVGAPLGMPKANFAAQIPAIMNAVHDVAMGLNGSISAEHGIGIARREEFLRREPPVRLALMRALKAMIDPKNIMNPRVLL